MNKYDLTPEQVKKINQLITCIALQYGQVTNLSGEAKMAQLNIPIDIIEQVKKGGCDFRIFPREKHGYIQIMAMHDPDNPNYEPFPEIEKKNK